MPTKNISPGSGPELQNIADILAKSRKVVVVTGAGISTNTGIPDFRSENGFYALIQAQYDSASTAARGSIRSSEEIDDRPKKRRRLSRTHSSGSISAQLSEREPRNKRYSLPSRFFSNIPSTHMSVNQRSDDNKDYARTSKSHASVPVRQDQNQIQLTSATSLSPSNLDADDLSSSQSSASSRASLPNLKGKDLFDSIIWTDAFTTSISYTFVSTLRQKILNDVKSTTETHKFIKVLRDSGRLVRNYTQNIDMLEAREGLCTELQRGAGDRSRFSQKAYNKSKSKPESFGRGGGVEVVHLHGSLDALRCGLCTKLSSWDEDERHLTTLAGEAPECPWCAANNANREGRGRRSLAIGRLRPDIVLYGEEHPNAHLVAPLITHDLSIGPDVMLILGTSLRVHGLKVMVREFAKSVHGKNGKVIFVNQTKPPESIWGDIIDFWVEWDCDAWVLDLKERREDIWLPRGSLDHSTRKTEKSRPAAKNPAARRPDMANGAYLTCRIMKRLGQLAGRIEDDDGRTQNPDIQVPKHDSNEGTEIDTPVNFGSQSRQSLQGHTLPEILNTGKKRKSQPRPNAIRDNKDNAAHVVFNIMNRLHGLSRESLDPASSTRERREYSSKKEPLSIISANLPRSRSSKKHAFHGAMTLRPPERTQLPTPPDSDQATPEPPMTPETLRIKQCSSISAILSSPFNEQPIRIWRDGLQE